MLIGTGWTTAYPGDTYSTEDDLMKRVFSLLYAAFPAGMLLGQISTPARPVEGLPATGIPSSQQLRSAPKKFPPEMVPASPATGRPRVKLSGSYCVHPSSDRKSLSVQRCEPVPLRLVAPFSAKAPK